MVGEKIHRKAKKRNSSKAKGKKEMWINYELGKKEKVKKKM